jgi:hypothetical protein
VKLQCHKLLNWILEFFDHLQKSNLAMPQGVARYKSETSMPQAFETDFPKFWFLAKIKFANATTPHLIR